MRAVIFDIDGTLADVEHRRAHLPNWNKFFGDMHLDPVIEPIAYLARMIYPWKEHVIIVSARPQDYEEVTRKWLNDNVIYYDALYMRKSGDYREDSIVKAEILEQILKDGYEPFLVIDDRPQVVKMWREYGLTCLQCAPDEVMEKHDGKHFLDIMVGPSSAGKSTYISKNYPSHQIVSSDDIRVQLFGSRSAGHNPSDLARTFKFAHSLTRARLENHVFTVFDATNLKQKDRLSLLRSVPRGQYVRYIVVDRPYDVKMKDRDWRPEELVHKHHKLFHAELKNILAGDEQPNVVVVDTRKK